MSEGVPSFLSTSKETQSDVEETLMAFDRENSEDLKTKNSAYMAQRKELKIAKRFSKVKKKTGFRYFEQPETAIKEAELTVGNLNERGKINSRMIYES